jgi:predicted Zn-dependent protease
VAEPDGPRIAPEQIAAALPKAEELFQQREDVAKLREAVAALRSVRDYRQRNFDVEWRYAKYNYFLGKQSLDAKEQDAAFEEGKNAAKIASTVEPQKPDGYFWYGANLGEIARKNMLTVGVKSIGDIRGSMEKVLEIDPRYQNSSAADALAQLEIETRLYGGSAEKAASILEKALETEHDNMNLRLHAAEAYLLLKKEPEAKKHLEELIKMKPSPDYAIEGREALEKGKKLLATRF